MKPEQFAALKPGQEVEFVRGRMKGVRAVVTAHVGNGCHVRVTLRTSGRGMFARATTVRVPKQAA